MIVPSIAVFILTERKDLAPTCSHIVKLPAVDAVDVDEVFVVSRKHLIFTEVAEILFGETQTASIEILFFINPKMN